MGKRDNRNKLKLHIKKAKKYSRRAWYKLHGETLTGGVTLRYVSHPRVKPLEKEKKKKSDQGSYRGSGVIGAEDGYSVWLSTSVRSVLGECGRHPILADLRTRWCGYWWGSVVAA